MFGACAFQQDSRHSCGQVLLYSYETDFTQGLLKKNIL